MPLVAKRWIWLVAAAWAVAGRGRARRWRTGSTRWSTPGIRGGPLGPAGGRGLDGPDGLRAERRPDVLPGVGDQAVLDRRGDGRPRRRSPVQDAGRPPGRDPGRDAPGRPDPGGPGRPVPGRPDRAGRDPPLRGQRPLLRRREPRRLARARRPPGRARSTWPARSTRPGSGRSPATSSWTTACSSTPRAPAAARRGSRRSWSTTTSSTSWSRPAASRASRRGSGSSPRRSSSRSTRRSRPRPRAGASVTVQAVGPRRFTVRGQVPVGHKPVLRVYEVEEPAAFARALFIETLRNRGVKVGASPLGENPAAGAALEGRGRRAAGRGRVQLAAAPRVPQGDPQGEPEPPRQHPADAGRRQPRRDHPGPGPQARGGDPLEAGRRPAIGLVRRGGRRARDPT